MGSQSSTVGDSDQACHALQPPRVRFSKEIWRKSRHQRSGGRERPRGRRAKSVMCLAPLGAAMAPACCRYAKNCTGCTCNARKTNRQVLSPRKLIATSSGGHLKTEALGSVCGSTIWLWVWRKLSHTRLWLGSAEPLHVSTTPQQRAGLAGFRWRQWREDLRTASQPSLPGFHGAPEGWDLLSRWA